MKEKAQFGDYIDAAAFYMSVSVILGVYTVESLKQFADVDVHSGNPVLRQFIDHTGNLALDSVFAFTALYTMNAVTKKANLSRAQSAVSAGALGLMLGAGFNAIPDTQIGMDHIGKYLYHCDEAAVAKHERNCTVDLGDFAWGTIGAGILALSWSRWSQAEATNHVDEDAIAGASGVPGASTVNASVITSTTLPLDIPTTHMLYPQGA